MYFLPELFKSFIAQNADRKGILQQYLSNLGVDSVVVPIDGKEHILVQFGAEHYNPQFKIKTVVAHYDRVDGSPGANDNSAADFQIAKWAATLKKMETFHNVRIFFTDGEELGWNTGVNEQGAFGIASVFKRLGVTNDDVYVFDACGRGEVPVLAKTVLPNSISKSFVNSFDDLYTRTQDVLRRACPGRWMTLPVPYSDNASFLACGIPAVAITMLPASEATAYARDLMRDSSLSSKVMNRESSKKDRLNGTVTDYGYKDRIPLTWKLFHTEKDNMFSLTPESFRVMENILNTLAMSKTFA